MLNKIIDEYINLLRPLGNTKNNEIFDSTGIPDQKIISELKNYLIANNIPNDIDSFTKTINNVEDITLKIRTNSYSRRIMGNYSGLASGISTFGNVEVDFYLKLETLLIENMSLKRNEHNNKLFHKSLLTNTVIEYKKPEKFDLLLSVIDDQIYTIAQEHSDIIFYKYKMIDLLFKSIALLENNSSQTQYYDFISEKHPELNESEKEVKVNFNELLDLVSQQNDFLMLTEDKDLISDNLNTIKTYLKMSKKHTAKTIIKL